MAKQIVSGETPFKAAKFQFAVGPSESGYQIAYSVDKEHWALDDDAIVPANDTLIYNGSMQYAWYMLSGNTSEVEIIL
ncbi:MAG: hypothetical protein J6U51_06980 [Bacteroidales bacterium]|nr:hypothetical protein [Bacteroidales bacterium]